VREAFSLVTERARQARPVQVGTRTLDVGDIAGTAVGGGDQRGGDFLPLRPFRGHNWSTRWQRLRQAQDRLAVLPRRRGNADRTGRRRAQPCRPLAEPRSTPPSSARARRSANEPTRSPRPPTSHGRCGRRGHRPMGALDDQSPPLDSLDSAPPTDPPDGEAATRRLTVVWPDRGLPGARTRPSACCGVGCGRPGSSWRSTGAIGRLDAIVGCGDLEPRTVSRDAFGCPVFVRGNHDRGGHWSRRPGPDRLSSGHLVDVARSPWRPRVARVAHDRAMRDELHRRRTPALADALSPPPPRTGVLG
jgi:hypothetical protein